MRVGAPAKQTVTTRSQDGYSTGTLTTYYVRSTVLGGKSVSELDATGTWTSSTIYADGMKLASFTQSTPSTTALLWLHADPVSGHTAYSGRVAETGGLGQFDPLGNEVSSVPDPAEYEEPPYTNPDLPFFWPIENHSQAWAWEGDLAMAEHVLRVNAEYDRGRAEYFWGHGRRDICTGDSF